MVQELGNSVGLAMIRDSLVRVYSSFHRRWPLPNPDRPAFLSEMPAPFCRNDKGAGDATFRGSAAEWQIQATADPTATHPLQRFCKPP